MGQIRQLTTSDRASPVALTDAFGTITITVGPFPDSCHMILVELELSSISANADELTWYVSRDPDGAFAINPQSTILLVEEGAVAGGGVGMRVDIPYVRDLAMATVKGQMYIRGKLNRGATASAIGKITVWTDA